MDSPNLKTSPPTILEEWIDADDGIQIYHRTWQPSDGRVAATVVFTHGIGEHIKRYDHVFDTFARNGIKVRSFDQRGFGETAVRNINETLGHNQGYNTVLSDALKCSDLVRMPSVPHFVMGHSMGGGIALRFAAMHDRTLAGVIASAPCVEMGPGVGMNLAKRSFLAGFAWALPSFVISTALDESWLSNDPAVIEKYKKDPLNHEWASMGVLNDMNQNGSLLLKKLGPAMQLPVYIAFGTKDQLTSYAAGKRFFDICSSKDKHFESYEGLKHELHNEPEQRKVINGYVKWILDHSSQK